MPSFSGMRGSTFWSGGRRSSRATLVFCNGIPRWGAGSASKPASVSLPLFRLHQRVLLDAFRSIDRAYRERVRVLFCAFGCSLACVRGWQRVDRQTERCLARQRYLLVEQLSLDPVQLQRHPIQNSPALHRAAVAVPAGIGQRGQQKVRYPAVGVAAERQSFGSVHVLAFLHTNLLGGVQHGQY